MNPSTASNLFEWSAALPWLALGVVLATAVMFWSAKKASTYEIKGIHLGLVLIPLFLWLLGTGKINELSAGGVGIKMQEVFSEAVSVSIQSQVTESAPMTLDAVLEDVNVAVKGSVGMLPRAIRDTVEALSFRLGSGSYYGLAIQAYFESLLAHSFLRFAVIENSDGSLFGVYRAGRLERYLSENRERAFFEFADLINIGDNDALLKLQSYPGFIPGENAVNTASNKKRTLEKMEELNMDLLPVVDKRSRFMGMVDRTRLTASLILDIATRLEEK